ncbi:MAG TPA: hypothetical protein VLM91_21810 [Candidatus Methylomirabilis sp.]|nr:hypothetical protein [Candidatus Methylomirabilis sp.]
MGTAITNYEVPPRDSCTARFAAVGGLVLILVTACLSAFAMLIWGL